MNQPYLRANSVLAVAQNVLFDLAHRLPGFNRVSAIKTELTSPEIGLLFEVVDWSVLVGNADQDVFSWIDGRSFDRDTLSKNLIAIARTVQSGDVKNEAMLDIELRRTGPLTAGVSSRAMNCDFAVKLEKLPETIAKLKREWADLLLAEGDFDSIKIVTQVGDPDALLVQPTQH